MKFTFISAMIGSPWGGSEELWSQTATQLKLGGHDVRASVMYRPQPSHKLTALLRNGIGLETYPAPSHLAGNLLYQWNRISLGYRRTYRRLKRFRPNLVIISQGHNSGGLHWAKVCRAAAIPYVMIVHCNSESWWFQEQLSDAVASYTAARRVFCVSRGNLDLLRSQLGEPLPNAEVVWSPYNVSTEPAPPWPADTGKWRLACPARLDLKDKGQDLLLRTMARPEWRDRPVELNLFGSGPDEQALRRLCGLLNLNNVNFHGHVADIRAIWKQNHVLVLPSRHEGLPLALIEAMWCARPVVVTDVGGSAELCVDGQTGFVAPAPTVPLLADALERAWSRRAEWQQMGEAGRTRVENLVPKDPAALFCERLIACASA